MAKKLAVVVTHGIGSASDDFDKILEREVRQLVGPDVWDDIHWLPIRWSHVLNGRQNDLKARMKDLARWNWARGFVIDNLSDAAAYQYQGRTTDRHKRSAYYEINDVFYQALKQARSDNEIDDNTHIIGVAQSMGCQILSNYIWDMSTKPERITDDTNTNPVVRLENLCGLFMTGCNIPLLLMAFEENWQVPIKFPGPGVSFPKEHTMWETYFDKDDLLGYPIAPTYKSYYGNDVTGHPFDAEQEVPVRDNIISSGGLLSGPTPLSHTHYWEDSEVLEPLAEALRKFHMLVA